MMPLERISSVSFNATFRQPATDKPRVLAVARNAAARYIEARKDHIIMRAETQALIADIKQSLGLLRRHL
jgi:hypothetical protein